MGVVAVALPLAGTGSGLQRSMTQALVGLDRPPPRYRPPHRAADYRLAMKRR